MGMGVRLDLGWRRNERNPISRGENMIRTAVGKRPMITDLYYSSGGAFFNPLFPFSPSLFHSMALLFPTWGGNRLVFPSLVATDFFSDCMGLAC
jgi:hypothetical protein